MSGQLIREVQEVQEQKQRQVQEEDPQADVMVETVKSPNGSGQSQVTRYVTVVHHLSPDAVQATSGGVAAPRPSAYQAAKEMLQH